MRWPFHPVLFGIYPVLALYSLNTSLVPVTEVPLPLGLSVGLTLAFWLIVSLVLRSFARGAIAASVGILGVFAYGHLGNVYSLVAGTRKTFDTDFMLFWIWCGTFVPVMIAACWKWRRREQITQAFNFAALILTAFPVISITASWISVWQGFRVTHALGSSHSLQVNQRPDVYYIILDGYGRSDALKRVIGFSNDTFIGGLKKRGFIIPSNSRSNYCETELSISSSLNLDYLQSLLPDLNSNWKDRSVLDRLIDRSEVSKYLRSLGYGYDAITTGFPAIQPNSADLWLYKESGLTLFDGFLLAETPFPNRDPVTFETQFETRRKKLRKAFEYLDQYSVANPMPRFFFVHVLAPHPPFVFDANGNPIKPKHMGFSIVDGDHYYQNGGTPREYAEGYAGQAAYLDKLVLASVDKILQQSKIPPVIVIQGDHGSKLRLNQELVDKTDLNECFPNLNAFYVPKNIRSKIYDGITPVNSFRIIFNGLFGDQFARLPDRSYYSGWSTPFQFIDVTDRIQNVPIKP